MMPLRRNEPGYFVVVDEAGKEIPESRRTVPEGFNRKGDSQIVEHLLRTKGEGCEVVFRPL